MGVENPPCPRVSLSPAATSARRLRSRTLQDLDAVGDADVRSRPAPRRRVFDELLPVTECRGVSVGSRPRAQYGAALAASAHSAFRRARRRQTCAASRVRSAPTWDACRRNTQTHARCRLRRARHSALNARERALCVCTCVCVCVCVWRGRLSHSAASRRSVRRGSRRTARRRGRGNRRRQGKRVRHDGYPSSRARARASRDGCLRYPAARGRLRLGTRPRERSKRRRRDTRVRSWTACAFASSGSAVAETPQGARTRSPSRSLSQIEVPHLGA